MDVGGIVVAQSDDPQRRDPQGDEFSGRGLEAMQRGPKLASVEVAAVVVAYRAGSSH